MRGSAFIAIQALAAALSAFSCSGTLMGPSRVPRQDLFNLDIGKMEDQLDLSDSPETLGKLRIYMRDGLFFISNGQGRKVMKLSSYGDLLSIVYDPEYDPPPVLLGPEGEGGALKRVIQHPLREAGEIVVNSRKDFYVEDRLPPDRRVEAADGSYILDAVVLRFGQDGSYRDYLGQEGPGGTPFPNVIALHCTAQDEIVVVCATPADYGVYWFADSGDLKYSLSVKRESLPWPEGGEGIASLEKIVPDPLARRVYMKIDYYSETVDPSTGAQTGVEYDQSIVWSIDPEDGRVYNPLKVPSVKVKDDSGFSQRAYTRSYELLGVVGGGHFCFIMPEEDGSYSLLVLDEPSGKSKKIALDPAGKDIVASAIQLGLDGIVSGIFVSSREARVSWWRLDKVLGR